MSDRATGHGPLGERASHSEAYDPRQLFPIPRAAARSELAVSLPLPFFGEDIWNAYELSWLDPKGVPRIAVATIRFAADTLNLLESKSVKLYLNSFYQTSFSTSEEVAAIMETDLRAAAQGDVSVALALPEHFDILSITEPEGICLDRLATGTDTYLPDPGLLATHGRHTSQRLYSNLLRTRCPVTGQPDWATIIIDYAGPAIDREGLLRYIISFREHAGFHENCVERIFVDIADRCRPENLIVLARFTRRGGIDINPFRSTRKTAMPNQRLARQ
jgi:7-cyano-7-deazaguanine reductase